ncbi:hypothetical protein N1851_015999 [Merluccius polli]|uniref:Uncharacterized protein n=1 Tax=Merluccius polli TaxID=89951 RepID=A0AA47MR43_MERPO|nr:hypothetical protein N1851_015999 [Merluccius polli]
MGKFIDLGVNVYAKNKYFPQELVDEPVLADQPLVEKGSNTEPVTKEEEEEEDEEEEEARPSVVQAPSGQLAPGGLLSQAAHLSSRATAEELGLCSAEQLVRLHDALGGVMRSVVLELQSRLCQADG